VSSQIEQLRELLAEIVPAHRAKWGESDEWEALLDFQRAVGAAGWSAPAWPVEIGGRGLTLEEQIACDGEFARAKAPTQVSVYGVNNVGPTIAAVGTPKQKVHLHRIAAVEELWCQGFSEPDAGSDLAGLRTRADVDDDGFTINGQKVWTSIGLHATHCMLLVRTNPDAAKHKGISALLVPLDTPGITRRGIRQINGKTEFAELFFEEVRVPRAALLGPLNEGWRVTMTTLGFERAGVISMAGRLSDEVAELIDPSILADLDPTKRQRLMKLYTDSRILGWLGQRALHEALGGGPPGNVASVIKAVWSKLGLDLGEVQLDMAGIDAIAGQAPEPMQRFLTSRAMTIAGGTTEVVKNLLGERNLGLPKEPG
jgi:3-oxochol-4-en-24-oyl-CoA dehydrogenase